MPETNCESITATYNGKPAGKYIITETHEEIRDHIRNDTPYNRIELLLLQELQHQREQWVQRHGSLHGFTAEMSSYRLRYGFEDDAPVSERPQIIVWITAQDPA